MAQRLDVAKVLTAAFEEFAAGRMKPAERLAKQLDRAQAGHPGANYLLGLIALAERQPRRAIDPLRKSLAATPTAPAPNMAMARALAASGRQTDAARHYRAVLAALPDDPDAHLELANLLRRSGETAEAEHHYRRVTALTPARAEAHNDLGALLREANRPAEALDSFEAALAQRPNWPTALANKGVALRDLGRRGEAAACLAAAVQADPGHIGAMANLATVLLELDRPDEAAAAATAAVAAEPDDAGHHLTLGLIRRRQGRAAQALTALRTAVRRDAKLAEARFALGQALAEAGEAKAAAEQLRAYLTLDPEDRRGAALVLARVEGTTPEQPPAAYVRALFDDYAERYDDSLRQGLRYQGPELFAQVLAEVRGGAQPVATALDAGCGTGLCAPVLRPLAQWLEGIDLAPRMVEKARATGLYDAVAEGELVAFLAGRPARWDLIVAADVFVYLGDLAPVLAAARTALLPGGLLAFSVEKGAGDGFALGPKQRYLHSEAYVRAAAETAGFRVALLREAVLREEAGVPAPAMIAVLA